MEYLKEKSAALEGLYSKRISAGSACAVSLRYWLLHRISRNENGSRYLQKAYNFCVSYLSVNPPDIAMFMLKLFFEIEIEDIREAETSLEKLKKSRSYFKSNEPRLYCCYLFLDIYLDISSGRQSRAKKKLPAFTAYSAENMVKGVHALLSGIYNRLGEYDRACACLETAYAAGDNSCFFYVALSDCIRDIRDETKINVLLIRPLLRWGLSQHINFSGILLKYNSLISGSGIIHSLGTEIYDTYKLDWVLTGVCADLMADRDLSLRAYNYYREAESRQLELNGLYHFLISAAYENNIENLSRYSIEQFIKHGKADKKLEIFIDHLIISSRGNSGLLSVYEKKIAEFGVGCYRYDYRDRYFNSIYKLIAERGAQLGISAPDIAEAKKRLGDGLFKYDVYINNPRAKSIWIYEKELRDMKAYPVTDGMAEVTACGDDFSCYLMAEGQKAIISDTVRIRKRVQGAGIELYKMYIDADALAAPCELLVSLSKHVISVSEPGAEWINVLEKTLADTRISSGFKMQASACLGTIYAGMEEYGKAVGYFNAVDVNYIDEKQIEKMLLAYVNSGEYKHAANLIIKKNKCFSEKSLFYSVKRVIQKGLFLKELANSAFELIVNGWYDKALIDVVIKHYNGSQSDWHKLSKTLDELSIPEPKLDEIILKNTIWMHMFDKGSQDLFVRMTERDPSNPLLCDFADYCAYEMIVNAKKPEYLTVDLLERRCVETGDSVLAYALCHYYIINGIQTLHSEKILAETLKRCESDELFFPVFKQLKDKSQESPYIEKNQPFLFKSKPDMTVCLHYRFGDDLTEFKIKRMKYFKFGIFITHVASFYGEKITYFFSEEAPNGSVATREECVTNTQMNIIENSGDVFFEINNALIYEQLFKYEKVEEIITERLKEKPHIKSWII